MGMHETIVMLAKACLWAKILAAMLAVVVLFLIVADEVDYVMQRRKRGKGRREM